MLKERNGVEVIKTVLLGSEGFLMRQRGVLIFHLQASLPVFRNGSDWCVGWWAVTDGYPIPEIPDDSEKKIGYGLGIAKKFRVGSGIGYPSGPG